MASGKDHLAARRYRRRHSRVSHMRSASVMKLVGLLAAELVGILVHDATVERRVSYLADWSGVREGHGGRVVSFEGWSKGLLTDERELGRASGFNGESSLEPGDCLFIG